MDWEKQDNELRQLMDGADFLPEEERWNAVAGWKKLQKKRQPFKKGLSGYWMQLTAAACLVGMLGFGLWWMQEDNPLTEADIVVQNKNDNTVYGNKVEISEQVNTQLNTSISIYPEKENSTNNFSTQNSLIRNEKKQKGNKHIQQTIIENPTESITVQKDETVIIAGNEYGKVNNENVVVEAPAAPANIPDIASIVPMKKPKMKVIHYNELNGKHATAPPVFVLTKKSETEWENLAVQNATTQRSQPYSLKIDISPAPKKSL